jgi:RimJ/RimL family protein N-acetyltransferase
MAVMLIKDVRRENGLMDAPAAGPAPSYRVRTEVLPGDGDAIVDLHARLYSKEYGMGEGFVAGVRENVDAALASGWPEGGGAWIVECDGEFAGSVGLTDEGDGKGRIRWVLLDPKVRGLGLGRELVGRAVERARELGMKRLELDTFSELTNAAKIYRGLGFRVVSARERSDWGKPIVYQYYELEL